MPTVRYIATGDYERIDLMTTHETLGRVKDCTVKIHSDFIFGFLTNETFCVSESDAGRSF
jgi:hypothetical protein